MGWEDGSKTGVHAMHMGVGLFQVPLGVFTEQTSEAVLSSTGYNKNRNIYSNYLNVSINPGLMIKNTEQ